MNHTFFVQTLIVMNTFYRKTTTDQLAVLLVVLLSIGYGIQYLNTFIELSNQVLFVDISVTVLVLIGVINFLVEKENS